MVRFCANIHVELKTFHTAANGMILISVCALYCKCYLFILNKNFEQLELSGLIYLRLFLMNASLWPKNRQCYKIIRLCVGGIDILKVNLLLLTHIFQKAYSESPNMFLLLLRFWSQPSPESNKKIFFLLKQLLIHFNVSSLWNRSCIRLNNKQQN